jgi:hypothetical protein
MIDCSCGHSLEQHTFACARCACARDSAQALEAAIDAVATSEEEREVLRATRMGGGKKPR